MKIPKTDAQLILRQTHRFPLPQSQCNASCVFYGFCLNSHDFEPCKGFLLMDGENLKEIERILHDPHIGEYIQNSYHAVLRSFNNDPDPDFAEAILRDIAEKGKIINTQIKKVTQIYDGNKLYSVKEEKLPSLEQQEFNASTFGYFPIPNENVRKPPKPPEPPKIETEEAHILNIREKLGETLKPQQRSLETRFPEICTPNCEFARQCPYGNARNWNKPCLKREELYRNK